MHPRFRSFLPLTTWAVLVLGSAPKSAESPLPPLNAKVLAFARSQIGKRVDRGECTDLARAALQSAGAQRFPFQGRGDFVWGEPVSPQTSTLPGDILQFRNAVFQGKRYVTRRRWATWHQEYPHHTAIVAGVSERGKVLTILHQNVGGPGTDEDQKRIVQEGTIRLDSLQEGGKVWIYRPVPRPAVPQRPEHDFDDLQ